MKKIFKMVITIGTLLPILVFSTAAAVESTTTSTDSTVKTTSTDEETTIIQRLEARKTQAKLKLTAVELTRIQTKCKAAQSLLTALSTRVDNVSTNRGKVYSGMVTRLTELSAKLKAQNVDTAELDKEITTLKTKTTKFTTDMDTYKQDIKDMGEMDCSKDPTAFKSTLELSRTLQKTIIADAADIRTYVNDTIKPTLKKLKTKLDAGTPAEGGTQ